MYAPMPQYSEDGVLSYSIDSVATQWYHRAGKTTWVMSRLSMTKYSNRIISRECRGSPDMSLSIVCRSMLPLGLIPTLSNVSADVKMYDLVMFESKRPAVRQVDRA